MSDDLIRVGMSSARRGRSTGGRGNGRGKCRF